MDDETKGGLFQVAFCRRCNANPMCSGPVFQQIYLQDFCFFVPFGWRLPQGELR